MSVSDARVSDLPPPTSGLFLEISFRRLLKSCAEIMAGDNKGREDLTAWQRSPVFHHVGLHALTVRGAFADAAMSHARLESLATLHDVSLCSTWRRSRSSLRI